MYTDNGVLNGASALLTFTVENTLSYRGETELSLAATRLAEKAARRDLRLAGRKYLWECSPRRACSAPTLPASRQFSSAWMSCAEPC